MPAVIQTYPKNWRPGQDTEFRLKSNSLFSQGINPGAPDVFGPLAQVWVGSIPVPKLDRRQWMAASAFFSRLAGIKGYVRMFDPKRPRPGRDMPLSLDVPWSDDTFFGDGTGWGGSTMPPFVSLDESADAGDDSVVLAGLPPSVDSCLWAGDVMEFRPNGIHAPHGMFHEVAYDAPTNVAGKTRAYLNPPLRKGLALGDMAVLQWATSVFRAIDDDQGIINHMAGGTGTTGFALIEVLP